MRAAGAMAGMASAAIMLAPGCGNPKQPGEGQDPVRRANFRSLAARDFLFSCTGGPARMETAAQVARHEELKQLAYRKGEGQALALGENDWAAVRRYDERERCAPGEQAYREALVAFSATLDRLAASVAETAQ